MVAHTTRPGPRLHAEPQDLDLITIGETMGVVRSSRPGPLARAATADLGIGGAESNVAIGVSRLGHRAAWIGRVGHDAWGDRIVMTLRGEDVLVRASRDPAAPTGLLVREQRTNDLTTVWYYRDRSAGSCLGVTDVAWDLLEQSRILHVTGITLGLSARARETVEEAVARARTAGVAVSFDVNHRHRVWRDTTQAREAYAWLAGHADIMFAGEDEAALLVGAHGEVTDDNLLHRLAELGPQEVVLKRGARGATALDHGRLLEVPAVPVRVVDAVGAGDAFVAGYLSGRLDRADLRTRLLRAVSVGAFVCACEGDWEGAPSRAELARLDSTEPVSR